ncbi:MAG: DUF3622 domain-containing protein [Psychromonas sp.]
MAQQNKFAYHITQDGDKWHAEITRRVTARKTSVSKQKKGFESEESAQEWAKETLAEFIANQQVATKRKADKRIIRDQLAAKAEAEKIAAAALYEKKRLAAMEAREQDEDTE